jgi:hypothetical protein
MLIIKTWGITCLSHQGGPSRPTQSKSLEEEKREVRIRRDKNERRRKKERQIE